MSQIGIPETIADVTPEWLNSRLSNHSSFSDDTITHLERKSLGEGSGFVSDMALLNLGTSRGESYQLVLKLHSQKALTDELSFFSELYANEALFYSEIAQVLNGPTPKAYLCEYDVNENRFCLLMDYIDNSYLKRQVEGLSLEESELAVGALADIHAASWNNQKILGHPALSSPDSGTYKSMVEWSKGTFSDYASIFESICTQAQLYASEKIATRNASILKHVTSNNLALCHGDYRSENLLYSASSPLEVTVIDWQGTSRWGIGLDLAHLLGGSLSITCRQQWLNQLLEIYYEQLLEGGVKGYSKAQFNDDFVYGLMTEQAMLIYYTTVSDRSNPFLKDLHDLIVSRVAAFVEDMDCVAMLD